MANIKLKDITGQEQTYEDVKSLSVPKADGSGREYYVERPIINYTLLDPPTHDLDTTYDVIAINWGEGTLFGEMDRGNFIAQLYPAVEGKTTKPIVLVSLTSNVTGATLDEKGGANFIYCYEALSSATLKEVMEWSDREVADFTTQVGWGQLLGDVASATGAITGYTPIADTSAVTLGIQQPVTYFSEANFYAILSEATQEKKTVEVTQNGSQRVVPTLGTSGIREMMLNVNVAGGGGNLQEKTVAITQNGTTEVAPDTGYDGLSKATINVNVAGGGSGVQPDWNQNDSTAADYIKGRLGGFIVHVPQEVKTYTFDGNLEGREIIKMNEDTEEGAVQGLVKISDDMPSSVQLYGSQVTLADSGENSETMTLPENMWQYEPPLRASEIVYVFYDKANFGEITITPGIWCFYMAAIDATQAAVYISSFTTATGTDETGLGVAYDKIPSILVEQTTASEFDLGSVKVGGRTSSGTEYDDVYINDDGVLKVKSTGKAVLYDQTQTLTSDEKQTAKENIGLYRSPHFKGYPTIGFYDGTNTIEGGGLGYGLIVGEKNVIKKDSEVCILGQGNTILSSNNYPRTGILISGNNNTSDFSNTAIFGRDHTAPNSDCLICGKSSDTTTVTDARFIVGNGPSATNLTGNAFWVGQAGTAWVQKTLEADGIILRSSTEGSTKKFKITVDDTGALTTAEVV